MATEPNDVRRTTLRRLRQELVADIEVVNNLLHELNRYLEQLRTRALELLRVEVLPNDPLIKYGFSALERNYQEESFTHKEEMAPMALSDSEVKTCSKTCLKNYETLKKQCDDLIVKLNQTEFTAATYKRGLATVEEQLITYRKNEVLFSEEVAVLKREVACKDYEINVPKSECEKVKQEKDGIEFKIEKFDKASKDLDQLLGSQITDKSKKGLGYSAVPPPHPLIYNRPNKLDLSYSGLEEFQEPDFEGYRPKAGKSASKDMSNEVRKSNDAPLIEKLVSDDKSEKKIVFPTVAKIEFVKSKQQEKPVRKPVKYAKMYRSGTISLNIARQSHFNVVRTNRVNEVKASACWVWRPIKPNSASITLKRYDYVDGNPETKLEDSLRLNSPEDKKLMLIEKITSEVNAD
ncbi:hypothetical protein Tco_1351168 [Tanacetum coccineum]